jgi:hypothetical protein
MDILFKDVGILFINSKHYRLLKKVLEEPNFITYIRNRG